MKTPLLTLLLIVLTGATVTAQRIEAEKVFGGYRYTQDGRILKMGDLVDLMEPDTEAYDLMRSARSNYTIANVLALPGGALVGWPLGSALAGGDPNWTLAAIGGGLIVATIPFSSAANKKSRAAVDLYNEAYALAPSAHRPQYALSATRNGYGLVVRF